MSKIQKLQFNIMFRPEPEGGFTAIEHLEKIENWSLKLG